MSNNITNWRTFPIFISSTFKDMHAERDMIRKIVIPRLEETLRDKRIELKVIDLRWGVDTSVVNDAERESAVLKVCLDAIKNNRPFFIGLLGERYGWRPESDRWKALCKSLPDNENKMIESGEGKSVTELEILFGALGNADEILSRSLFYFRKKESLDGIHSDLLREYYLEEDNSEKENKLRKQKLSELKTEIRHICEENNYGNAVREYSLSWDKNKQQFEDVDFCEQLYHHLLQEIEEEIKDTAENEPHDWYDEENRVFNDFVYTQTKHFTGRREILQNLSAFLVNQNSAMILTGFSGSGKSALICKLYQTLKGEKPHDRILLAHSAGVTIYSLSAENMLQRWIKTMCETLGCEENINEQKELSIALAERFGELILLAGERGYKIIMLVDALDRFSKSVFSEYMQWLPENVSFLATSLPEATRKPLEIHPEIQIKNIDAFTETEARDMMKGLSHSIGKQLPENVLDKILQKETGKDGYAYQSPLWLQLVGHVLFGLDADDFKEIRERKELLDIDRINGFLMDLVDDFSGNAGDVFVEILKRASDDYGVSLTNKAMSYLSISRNGLREKDLAVLLNNDWSELNFALLRRWLGDLITENRNNRQWKLSHHLLCQTILEKINQEALSLHDQISAYLLNLPDDDPLRVSEIMYHLVKANRMKDGAAYYATMKKQRALDFANQTLLDFYNEDTSIIDWLAEGIRFLKDNTLKCHYAHRLIRVLFEKKAFGDYPDYISLCRGLFEYIDYKNYNLEQKRIIGIVSHRVAFWNEAKEDTENLQFFAEICKECFGKLLEYNPDDDTIKNSYAMALGLLGDYYAAIEEYTMALDCFERMVQIKSDENQPTSFIEGEIRKSMAYQKMANLAMLNEDISSAKQYMIQYLECMEGIYYKYPNERLTKGVVAAYGMTSLFFSNIEDYPSLVEYSLKGIDLLKSLLQKQPDSFDYLRGYAQCLVQLGQAYYELEEHEKSYPYLTEAIALLEKLIKQYPEDKMIIQSKRMCEMILSNASAPDEDDQPEDFNTLFQAILKARDAGQYEMAINYTSKAIEVLADDPDFILGEYEKKKLIINLISSIGDICYENLKDNQNAEKYYRKTVSLNLGLYSQLQADNDEEIKDMHVKLSRYCRLLGEIAIKKQDFEAAQEYVFYYHALFKETNTEPEQLKVVGEFVEKTQEYLSKTIELRTADHYFDYVYEPWVKKLKEDGFHDIEKSIISGEVKLLKPVLNLYNAVAGLYDALKSIATKKNIELALNGFDIKNLFPYVDQRTKMHIKEDLEYAIDFLKEVYNDELPDITYDMDDDTLLDYAEKTTNNDITLALISFVESKIEYDGIIIYDHGLYLRMKRCLLEGMGHADYKCTPIAEFFQDKNHENEALASHWANNCLNLEFGHDDTLVREIGKAFAEKKAALEPEPEEPAGLSTETIINLMMNPEKLEAMSKGLEKSDRMIDKFHKELFNPPSYIFLSIVATIVCFPVGIIPLYQSFKTLSYKKEDNSWDARITSKKAKKWAIGCIIAAIFIWGLHFINQYGLNLFSDKSTNTTHTEHIYTVNTKVLNVRKGAGTSYPAFATLSQNDEVNVLEIDNNWAKIDYNGETGYVSLDYLVKNSGQENISLSAEQVRMSGWKTYGLAGRVKSVTYSSGEKLEFDEDGNLVSDDRQYESPVKYKRGGETYHILFPEKNVRYEEWESGTAEDIGIYYNFDDSGRIISCQNTLKYVIDVTYYEYDKQSLQPSSMTMEAGDETGSTKTTHKFSYVNIDDKGNWTKRRVEKSVEEEDYETEETKTIASSSFVETAKYTYYR